MPDEVNVFYSEGRELYLKAMDEVIDRVATVVETGLNAAKALIAKGKEEIDTYVASLDPALRQIGKEAAEGFQSQFDELEQSVNEKSEALVDSLAQKYVENLKKLDERIEEMKAANRGLVDKVVGAIKELIKTLRELANMLLNTLARAAAAIGKILKAPIRFLGNMVAAVKQGIMGFKAKIGEYLQEGLLAWLFGALGNAGITLPKSLDFKGILSLVLQVLGLTYANIRARAVKIVGEPVVKALEKGAEIFKILLTEGPAGLWSYVKEQLGNLQELVIEGIKGFIIEKIIVAGITWLIGLLNPASAFIKACKAIYDIVMFFVTRASQIMSFVNAVIDSMVAIADGNITAAAAAVESSLAKAIPVVIGFLASLLGLGGISEKIRSVIEKIRAPINKAIDWVIHKAVAIVKKVGKFLGLGKKEVEPGKPLNPEHDAKVEAGLHAIDVEEAAQKKPDGVLEQEAAEKIAVKVRRAHPIFKSIQVIAEGDHWTYDYRAHPGKKPGAKQPKVPVWHPDEGKLGAYPQSAEKAAAGKHLTILKGKKLAKAWESHHIPQKVLGKHIANVYKKAAKNASTTDKPVFKRKEKVAREIGEVGKDVSAVLLSNLVHDAAHARFSATDAAALEAKLDAENAEAARRKSDDSITAAGRASSFQHGTEVEKTDHPKRKQDMKSVFNRLHKGATIVGITGVNRALPAKQQLSSIPVSDAWKDVINPDQ
jgi:hypothetical protein